MNKAKMKQVAMIGGVALGTLFVLATLAKRVPAVAKIQSAVLAGV